MIYYCLYFLFIGRHTVDTAVTPRMAKCCSLLHLLNGPLGIKLVTSYSNSELSLDFSQYFFLDCPVIIIKILLK